MKHQGASFYNTASDNYQAIEHLISRPSSYILIGIAQFDLHGN